MSSNAALHLDALEPPPRPADEPGPADPPERWLAWAVQTFGDRAPLATSLGPQSLVLVDMLHRIGARLPVFFLDTGLLFAETLALRKRVQDRYGIDIQAVQPDLDLTAQASHYVPRLWDSDPDLCCQLRKVGPLRRHLAGRSAWITGVRRGHGASRAEAQTLEWDSSFGLWKLNPLNRWSRKDLQAYLRRHDVPTNPLLSQGYRSVGCRPCTSAVDPDADPNDERAGRWAGRTKTECGIHSRLTVLTPEPIR